ncbi:hypothetical protein ENUP19_0100G0031 [Entamoeba nuttalli]|uniref:Uncharacterized protein n=2 Tax=Entamoeba nuttalli TaxID=412467 RepID=K2GTA8_ENTNP|nr:hypothetical protein ENU1_172750 [Entamoeba nuttalli P19]EKE38243.1 hypothetical protein ENU1_172750 [Entamoeba nuttalli P19]|eukprot:XP_008859438.1 hypothetical protein ENU1_172750 [Entamoeba nuttalli P19]
MTEGVKRVLPSFNILPKKMSHDQKRFQIFENYNEKKKVIEAIKQPVNELIEQVENKELKAKLSREVKSLIDELIQQISDLKNQIKVLERKYEIYNIQEQNTVIRSQLQNDNIPKLTETKDNKEIIPMECETNTTSILFEEHKDTPQVDTGLIEIQNKRRILADKQINEVAKCRWIEQMFGEGWDMIEVKENYLLTIQNEIISHLEIEISLCIVIFDGYGNVIGFEIEGMNKLNYYNEIHDVQCTLFSLYDETKEEMNCKMYRLTEDNNIIILFNKSGEIICKVNVNGRDIIKIGVPIIQLSSIDIETINIEDDTVYNSFIKFISHQDIENEIDIQGMLCFYKKNTFNGKENEDFIINRFKKEKDKQNGIDDEQQVDDILITIIQEMSEKSEWEMIFSSKTMKETNKNFNEIVINQKSLLINLQTKEKEWVCIYIEDKIIKKEFNQITNQTHFIYSTKTKKKYQLKDNMIISFSLHDNNCSLFTLGNRIGFIHIAKTKNKRCCVSRLSELYKEMNDNDLFNISSSINKFEIHQIIILKLS